MKTEKRELFAQGLSRGLIPTVSARNAGFSENGIHVTAHKLSRDPEIILRVSELIAKVAQIKAKVATDAFEAALAEIPGSLSRRSQAAVATAIRDRQYRLTVLQDSVDRLRMMIDERAAAGRALIESGELVAPAVSTGLLVRTQKNLREGKKTRIVDQWQYDSAVLSDLHATLKQGAIEAGEWQEEGRVLPPVGPDLSHLTESQLWEEQKLLRETREKIEAIRQRKEPTAAIEATVGSVERLEEDSVAQPVEGEAQEQGSDKKYDSADG